MSAEPIPAGWTRDGAVSLLRERLAPLAAGEHSICRAAADLGIFCGGFRRWNDHEFHHRWKATLGVSTHLTRPQMEQLADLWQQCEQLAHGVALACDAPTSGLAACRGWEEFTDREIFAFYCDLIGQGRLP